MEGPLLVLWALLVGWDAGLLPCGPWAAAQGFTGGATQPDVNLTCYQCFKVTSEKLCPPTACSPTDRVCVSHTMFFFLQSGMEVSLSKRCAPQCPNTSEVYEWQLDTQVLGRLARQCCSHNLCNKAPPNPGRPGALRGALLLLLGLSLPGALL